MLESLLAIYRVRPFSVVRSAPAGADYPLHTAWIPLLLVSKLLSAGSASLSRALAPRYGSCLLSLMLYLLADTRYFFYTAHLGSVRFPSLEPSASTPSSVFSRCTVFEQLCLVTRCPCQPPIRRTGFHGNNSDPYLDHHVSSRLCNMPLT